MTFGKKGWPRSESLARWAGFVRGLEMKESSKIPDEFEEALEKATTAGNSPYGGRSYGVHEQFFTISDYFKAPGTDRHFIKDFGHEWEHPNGDLYSLHYISSSGEFIIRHTDPTHRPQGFVLESWCPDLATAHLTLQGWETFMRNPHSLLDICELIERTMPR